MRTLIATLSLAVLISAPSHAQQSPCSGSPHVISVGHELATVDSVPAWSFQCDSLSEHTLVTLRRLGNFPSPGWGYMWVGTLRPSTDRRGFQALVAADLSKRRIPEATISAGPRLTTKDGRETEVRQIFNRRYGFYDLIAYVPADSVMPVLHMRAYGQAMLSATTPAFYQFVHAFAFVRDSAPAR